MTPNEMHQISNASDKYPGLDLLRIVSAFGVVFLHVYVSVGQPSSVYWFLKFRDFSLPVMVISSFFVLTVSLSRRSGYSFFAFLGRRSMRLWLPMVVWTVFYSVAGTFVLPQTFGIDGAALPSVSVFLTGYRHLWYLQFLFLGSLLVFPLIMFGTANRGHLKQSPLRLCVALIASAIFLFLFRGLFAAWDLPGPEVDISVQMFVSQSVGCLPFIPLAVATALLREKIGRWFTVLQFRWASFLVAGSLAFLHTATEGIPYTREAFAFAVFFTALQPTRAGRNGMLASLAQGSYGVYILHFLPVQIIGVLVGYKGYTFGGGSVVVLTAGIYVGCLAVASLARKIPAVEWLLPIAATAYRQKLTAPEHKAVPKLAAEAA